MKQLDPTAPELNAWNNDDLYHIIAFDDGRAPLVIRIEAAWIEDNQGDMDLGAFMQGVLMAQEAVLGDLGDPESWRSSMSQGVPHPKLLARALLFDWNVDDLD